MNNQQIQQSGQCVGPLTPRDIVFPIFRQLRLAIVIFAGIFLGSILAAILMPPEYQAEMKILVNRERVDPVVTPNPDAPISAAASPIVSEEDLNSEVELIKSRDLLEKVVLACNLQSQYHKDWRRFLERTQPMTRAQQQETAANLAHAVQALEERLIVEPLKKTSLIRISYESRDPGQSAKVLNTLGMLYEEKHAAVHRPPGTFRFFDQEVQRYRDEVALAESRLIAFDRKESIIDATSQKQMALEQLNRFQSELQQARANAYASSQRVHSLQSQRAAILERQTTSVRKGGNAQLLADLQDTLLKLELRRTDLLLKYAGQYPLVKEVETQISETRDAIAHAEESPIEEITTDRNPAQDWISTEIAKAKADQAAFEAQVVAYGNVTAHYGEIAYDLDQKWATQSDLVRNLKEAEENYALYLKKREDARISDALDRKRIVNVSIAQAATVPALSTMNLGWFLIGGFFAAVVASVGSAYVADSLDPRFRTPDELGRYLNIKVLASIPAAGPARQDTP